MTETRVRYDRTMLRTILGIPTVVADYTLGTMIVLFQLKIARR
jgi:hypothetical protein